MLEVLGIIGGIVLVDLVLSGDNALVIGAAAASLPRQQRYAAILAGGIGAIVLRILFTLAAALLLQLPLLQAIGGILLIAIAVKLLHDRERDLKKHTEASESTPEAESTSAGSGGSGVKQGAQRGFLSALLTIIVADVTMSLDNVLAVAALASEHIPLLIGGLLLSILILLVGSALVAELINRLPWLLDVAALVLGWTASNMILHDQRLGPILDQHAWTVFVIPGVILGVILAADIFFRLRRKPVAQRAIPAAHD